MLLSSREMRPFYGQLQGSMCNGQQMQAKEEENIKPYGQSKKELNTQIKKKFQKFMKNKKWRKVVKEL